MPVTAAVETFGSLDIVVNNAGVLRDTMLFNLTESQWDDVIRVHLKGHAALSRAAAVHWRSASKAAGGPVYGRVVNTSSEAFLFGSAGQPNYSAAKAGAVGFTKAVAQEGARNNITCNVVATGYIGTEMVKAVPEDVLKTKILPHIPVGRLGEPEEIARCVVFLASDDAGFITGSTLSANGGQYMA